VLVWNYLFASFCGWSMYLFLYTDTEIKNDLLKNAFLSGGLFLLIFYLISLCTQKFGMSMASMFNKSGYMLPLLFSYLVFFEKPNAYQWGGSMLGILSLFLALRNNKFESGKANYILPVLVIVGSGSIDTLMMWNERMHFKAEADPLIFSTLIFTAAFLFGSIFFMFKYNPKQFFGKHNALFGSLLGIPNFFSIFFLLQAIKYSSVQKSVLFGINNIGIVLISIIIGFFVFREKKTRYQWLGIAGLVFSLLLMNLNCN
jgi:drug/metabolite transporter (DMT)-like permease